MIHVSEPDLTGKESEYVAECFKNNWISHGSFAAKAEAMFASLCNTNHCVMVNSGSSALHLALKAAGVGPGDEVICPSLTYFATVAAIAQVNATPAFCDVSSDTWCIEAQSIEERITPRTKAILLVDLYGNVPDLDSIIELAKIHNLTLIDDSAEAHGALYKGRSVAELVDMACYSFYANKVITSAEGGAVVTSNPKLAAHLKILRGQGQHPHQRFNHPVVGFNFRMTDLQAAVLCAQIERFDSIIAKRRRIFDTYQKLLKDIPGIWIKPTPSYCRATPWLFTITVNKIQYGHSRDELMEYLSGKGVETRPLFSPAHLMVPFRDRSTLSGEYLPITEDLARTGMNLPTYNNLTQKQVRYICSLIRGYAEVSTHGDVADILMRLFANPNA